MSEKIDLDAMNAMHVALACGQSFEEAGFPDTPEYRRVWEQCKIDRKKIIDAGGEVRLPSDLPDRSSRIRDDFDKGFK